jgi:hypothetical protein
MKTLKLLKRAALMGGVGALLCAGSASAQASLDFVPFETGGVSNLSDLDYINIEGLVVATPGGVKIGIFNNSVPGDGWITASIPTITKIFFEDKANVLTSPTVHSTSGGVSLVRNDGATLPGGNNIGFVVESAFTATPPPVTNGIDPNEWAYFLFTGSDYSAVTAALASGTVRIGMHVQQIGPNGEDSAAFVNVPIPEPSVSLLGALGAALLFRRRR